MINSLYGKELESAVAIAKEAGEIMLKYFDEDQQIEQKADKSSVTIADKEINSLVIRRLGEIFPEDGVIGEEESNAEYGMGRKWVCDPIDGTAGYTWGTPTSMFSLALVIDGRPVIGVAFDPFLQNMFMGEKDQPSRCINRNGMERILHVNDKTFADGIMGIHGSVKAMMKAPYFQKLSETKCRMAIYSGLVHKVCLIAKGRLIGFIIDGANPHDLAAVHVILEGAGGKMSALDGSGLDYSKPFKSALASNGIIHDELVAIYNDSVNAASL